MKRILVFITSTFLIAGLAGILLFDFPLATHAQGVPDYGKYYCLTGSYSGVASTVAEELLPAPGAEYRWVVTDVNYEVLVAQASKELNILDHSGSTPAGATTGATSVAICDFAPTIAGGNAYHHFGAPILCAVNSAVMLEGISSTADIWVEVSAYKEKVESD